MRRILLSLLSLLTIFLSSAQDKEISRNFIISSGLCQVKESANYGLVFTGPGIDIALQREMQHEKREISLETELSLEILFSRKMTGVGLMVKPLHIDYRYRVPRLVNPLFLGPSLEFSGNYFLYPDLQAGFDYWFTNYNLGLSASYEFRIRKEIFRMKLNTSVLGFVSRQPVYRDPYFYDIGIQHAIRHLNQGLLFGSFGTFNISSFQISRVHETKKRVSMAYSFSYGRYYCSPEISFINHKIILIL